MSRFPRLPKVRCQKRPDGFFDLPPPQFCEQRQFDVERHFGGVNIDDTGDVADCGLQTEGATCAIPVGLGGSGQLGLVGAQKVGNHCLGVLKGDVVADGEWMINLDVVGHCSFLLQGTYLRD